MTKLGVYLVFKLEECERCGGSLDELDELVNYIAANPIPRWQRIDLQPGDTITFTEPAVFSSIYPAFENQPPPEPGKGEVLPVVLEMLRKRADEGEVKYGCRLQAHNGRNALVDAWQEAADLLMYLTQLIMEKENES